MHAPYHKHIQVNTGHSINACFKAALVPKETDVRPKQPSYLCGRAAFVHNLYEISCQNLQQKTSNSTPMTWNCKKITKQWHQPGAF